LYSGIIIDSLREGLFRMLNIAVIADDLTGAADTGIQFRSAYAPVYLVDQRWAAIGSFEPPAQALSIFTASRGLPPAEAHQVLAAVGRVLDRLAPQRVYKKIDSALRGNIGAELEALMNELKIDLSFIAPAYVEQGRTTVGGVHCLHGTPVAQTEMRRDPVAPVCESRLSDWIGFQAHFPIAHIGLEALNDGPDAAAREIDRAVARGVRHLTFDAAATDHLDRIARLALERYPQALLCGSAGLARSLARALGAGQSGAFPDRLPAGAAPAGHFLFVCGSPSERLRRQVDELAGQGKVGVETLNPAALMPGSAPACGAPTIRRAAARLAAGDLVVNLAPPAADQPVFNAPALSAGFADAAAAVVEASTPAGLFLSGGDTALAVLERLNTRAIRLECEVLDGLVLGRIIGGRMDGRTVVTKAGAFGPPDALLKLHAALGAIRDI
jgi:uncharacterized protein YgbK (DUF1537 family)